MNLDGKPDLIVPNFNGGSFSVFLQDPSKPGVFQSPQVYAAGANPAYAAVGDLDGDGLPDLVVTNYGAGDISIYRQDPAHKGQFLAPTSITVGSGPHRVVIAELNGDGKLDIAVACTFANHVAVLLQDASQPGTFQPLKAFAAGNNPTDLVVGDFNADGKPDVVVANFSSNDISVLLQDPTMPGNFLASTSFVGHSTPCSIAAADLDGDGKLDVVVANRASHDVSIWYGLGNGGFQPRLDVPAGSYPWEVKPIFSGGSRRANLVVANFGSAFGSPDVNSSLAVLLQDASNRLTWTAGPTYKAGSNPDSVAVDDLNGDGKPDLAVTNWGDDTLSILFGA